MTSISDRPIERQRRPSRSEVRDRLLDAARREFAARGFDGVSLEQVAAAAGFSKGAVYSNFSSKNELIFALMEQSATSRLDLARAESSEPNVSRGLGDQLTASFAADPAALLLYVEFWLRAMRDPELRETFVEHRRRTRQMTADEFERLVPGGHPELAPMEVATMMLGAINGLVMERLLDPESGSEALLGVALGRLLDRPSD